MKRTMEKSLRFYFSVPCIAMVLLLMSIATLYAQPGPSLSASYDLYPHSQIADPDIALLEEGEIRVGTLNLKASYPLIYSEGRTVLVNEVVYRRFDLDYRSFPPNVEMNPENMQAIEYNATVTHGLSDRWTFLGIATPGIASDFEGDIGGDDLTFQIVVVFIRGYSERFQIGYGGAWSNTFGQPFPLPILAVNWNNGSNLRVSSILPANLECWYAPTPRLELGLLLNVEGNQYHGDPDIYQVDNPLLRYSVGTFGPSINYHISQGLTVGASAGMTFLRRFKFFDGDDEEDLQDISLKNSGFMKVQLQIGG